MIVLLYGRIEYGGEEFQVFFHCQVLIQRESARHVTYDVAYLAVIFHYIASCYFGSAFVGPHQCGKYAEQCGLASSVWAYDAVQFAFVYREAEIFQGMYFAVCLVYVAYRNCCHLSVCFHFSVHASFYITVIGYCYFDGIDKVGAFVACLYGLGGKFGFVGYP